MHYTSNHIKCFVVFPVVVFLLFFVVVFGYMYVCGMLVSMKVSLGKDSSI